MRKIGEIKGVPVVEGNVNEVTKNQFHYKETGGGIQLSKRDSDNKLSSITSGSSNGDSGGDKESYYKIISNDYETIKSLFGNMLLIGLIYVDPYGKSKEINTHRDVTGRTMALCNLIDDTIIAFRMSNILISYIQDNEYITLSEGSLETKMLKLAELNGMPDVEIKAMIEQIHQFVTPITKEEYESLIEQPAIILGK